VDIEVLEEFNGSWVVNVTVTPTNLRTGCGTNFPFDIDPDTEVKNSFVDACGMNIVVSCSR
jgi:hypothetical protein